MLKKHALYAFTALFFLTLAPSQALSAQAPAEILINYPEVVEEAGADTLSLGVYFAVVDSNGRSLPDVSVQAATLQVLGQPTAYEASFSQPTTPFYIALVLDASGSMRQAIGDMRQAAVQAIEGAPPEARFAVVRFNETIDLVQDFSEDHGQIAAQINTVQTDNKGTCLYDAAYDAIERVNRASSGQPQARRAVILFTDGRDEQTAGRGDTCSTHTYDEVISLATTFNARVPVHTIGLSGDGTINEAELKGIAQNTGGVSAVGEQASLAELFQQIMDGLRSQWLAQAAVYVAQGEHTAVLEVTLPEGGKLSDTFTFTAGRDYITPSTEVAVALDSVRYDAAADDYLLEFTIVNPEEIGQLHITVWDRRDGVQVAEYTVEDLAANQSFVLSSNGLVVDREYVVRVSAMTPTGETIGDGSERAELAAHEFRHSPALPAVTSLAIDSVAIDYEVSQLVIKTRLENAGQIDHYEGWLNSVETNERVYDFNLEPSSDNLVVALDESIVNAGKYLVFLRAIGADDALLAEDQYEISFSPPPALSLLQRLGSGLRQNPIIIVAIILLIVAVVSWFMFRSRQEKVATGTPVLQSSRAGGALVGKLPLAERTVVFEPDAEETSVRLHVVETPDSGNRSREVEVTYFPYVIGREGCDLNIEDGRMSRQHASLTVEDGALCITDLGSSNGTLVNGRRIEAGSSHRLAPTETTVTVELGPTTRLMMTKLY